MPAYDASFPPGTRVRVVDRSLLEDFQRRWRLHNPVQDDQLRCAGQRAIVKSVGYYHGGDVLYQLEELPGIWHQCCLETDAP